MRSAEKFLPYRSAPCSIQKYAIEGQFCKKHSADTPHRERLNYPAGGNKMIKQLIALIFLLAFFFTAPLSSREITRKDYLETIVKAHGQAWQIYQESLSSWQSSPPNLREVQPPKVNLGLGRMDAFLYSITRDKKYAESARQVLLECPYYDNYYAIYIIKSIEGSGVLSAVDLAVIDQRLIEHVEIYVQYWAEWGTMNHATNIINSLTATMQRFPHHKDYDRWRRKRDINVSCNWGAWHIEDSQNYIAPWLKPLIQHVEIDHREKDFYAMPMVKYYFDYLVQLMTPEGQIAEFGDGAAVGDYTWTMVLSVLEKGASIYRDGKMKWAAHQLFRSNVYGRGQAYIGYLPDLVEAYLWADDTIAEEIPQDSSRLVLEDYVGKKVVFRNGWDAQATYLFLNYLEDAPFGMDGKEHIINTIPVETEKNHHGQADENSIGLLMKNGAILLHDSGYRETGTTGPDGEYRADTYHNRLVVRPGLADSQKRLLPYILDGGQCRMVQSKLLHFRTFAEVDVSRTRVIDQDRGYQWDRVISYLKDREWFVLFDIVKVLKNTPLTLATLYYTQDIVELDAEHNKWFDTRYRTIACFNQSGGFAAKPPSYLLNPDNWLYANPDNMRLLVYFPAANSFRCGAESIRRAFQTEQAIYQSRSDSLRAGDIVIFPTLLVPHERETDAKTISSNLNDLQILQDKNGYGIRIPTEDGYIQINAMVEPEAEYLTANVRPRYNWESGCAVYGDLETDARYCYLHKMKDQVSFAFCSATKLILNQILIFNAKGEWIGQDDGRVAQWGVPKWVVWEDKISWPYKQP